MLASAKYIGAGVACSGLIGTVSGSLIFVCFGILVVILPLVYLAGRAGKILDTVAKVVVIAAGSSNLYKKHGGGSGSSGDDSDKDKDKDKDKEKPNEDKEKEDTKIDNDTKKTNDSNTDGNTASK